MSETEEFSLLDLIRRTAITYSDVASPAVITELLLDDIPKERHEEIVAKLLPRYVADVLRRDRKAAVTASDKWDSFLRERVAVQGGYRFAAECSAPELRAASARRHKMAGALDRRGVLYATVATAVEGAGVTTPAQLSLEQGAASVEDLQVKTATAQAERLAAERALRRRGVLIRRREELEQQLASGVTPQLLQLQSEVEQLRVRLEEQDVRHRRAREVGTHLQKLLESS